MDEMTPPIGGNWVLGCFGQNGTRRTMTGTSSGEPPGFRAKTSLGLGKSDSAGAGGGVGDGGFRIGYKFFSFFFGFVIHGLLHFWKLPLK